MKSAAELVTKGAILRSVLLFAQVASALWLMPLLIHSLGDHSYGLWAVLSSIAGLLIIADLGMSPTSERFLAISLGREDRNDFNETMSSGLAFFVAVAVLVLAFVVVRMLWTGDGASDADSFNIAFTVIGAQVAIGFLFRPVTTALAAALRHDLLTAFLFLALVVRVALSTIFVLNGYGIIALAVIGLVSQGLMQICITIWYVKLFPWAHFSMSLVSFARIKNLLSFGAWVFGINITRTARFRVPPLLIAALLGPATVVSYAIASRLVEYVFLFVLNIVTVLNPLMSSKHGENDTESLLYYYFTSSRICAFISTIIVTSVLIFGESFIILWIGGSHREAIYPLIILLFAMYFVIIHLPAQSYLIATAGHQPIAIASVVEIAVALLLAIVLANVWGLNGVCAGIAIPIVLNKAGFEFLYVCRKLGVRRRRYIMNFARVILPVSAVQAGSYGLLEWLLPGGPAVHLFVGGPASAIGWGLAFFVALPAADRRLVMRSLTEALGKRKSQQAA